MQKFDSIDDLRDCVRQGVENEWVYVNMDAWEENPTSCGFYFISEAEVDNLPDDEVYESEAGPFLPRSLLELNLHPWMTIDALRGVFLNLEKSRVQVDGDLLVKAINHYREMDDFME